MPLAVVLALEPQDTAPWPLPGGWQARGWFLNEVRQINAAIADALHREPQGSGSARRPYTVSALMTRDWRPLPSNFPPTEPAWLRITALAEPLESLLWERLVPKWHQGKNAEGAKEVILGGKTFRLSAVATRDKEHPWAGSHTLSALLEVGRHDMGKAVFLQFASPTSFRNSGADFPLPVPERLLASWWASWNAAVPAALQLDNLWLQTTSKWVQIVKLRNITTARWRQRVDKGGGMIGFTGEVALRLRRAQTVEASMRPVYAAFAQAFHTLTAFSFYAGTGHHTTVGMGQTRPSV